MRESNEDDYCDIKGTTIRQQVVLIDDTPKSEPVVPPLENLRTSISPMNKLEKSNKKSLSDSTLNLKRNYRTSYAEADKDESGTLMNKWVDEDFGSCTTNSELNYDGHSRTHLSNEFIVPFHRTASATFFRESLASGVATESGGINRIAETTVNLTERKAVKKGRSIPEVHPTRTSRLREKETNNKNTSLASRRKKREVERPPKPKSLITSQNTSDDLVTNKHKNTSSISEDSQMTNIPSVSTR